MAQGKADFPVSDVRRYLEPGPIVLVSSAWRGKTNIMTMGWHTVMEFVPSLVGCMISSGNHSHGMIRRSGECVINVPTTALTREVIGIGNCSGAAVDKFKKFKLTAEPAAAVGAPLIRECHANFECRLKDDRLVDQYSFFIFEVVKAHVAPRPKYRRRCIIPATACSWWLARSSAGAASSGRKCCKYLTRSIQF
jgi:flavin reductase (DIM6/NTAB) family NADH-FMN oxidoreductase RutF